MMKNVVVIGASASIGNAIVERFLAAGWKVMATYHKTRLDYKHPNLLIERLDLQSEKSTETFTTRLDRRISPINSVIFLSGMLPGKNLADYELSQIGKVMEVNFTGQAKLLKKILPYLGPRANVIMTSSISAQRGSYDPIYAASKGAILSFVKSLTLELAPAVRINAVAPGLIKDSRMFNDMPPDRTNFHLAQTPMKQLLTATKLASILLDLCSEHWDHLAGACIDLNGGQYLR